MNRAPAVAGRFYPASPDTLRRQVAAYCEAASAPPVRAARMLVGPHAGYVYSGAIAGATYASVEVPRRVILIGPNHTGAGARCSLWGGDEWDIPGGPVAIDTAMVQALDGRAGLTLDTAAHTHEHSLEVHVPFLLHRRPDVAITPICLGRLDVDGCRRLGEALADAISASTEPVLLAISTDMSHFLTADAARELDALALERVKARDPVGLHQVVGEHRISMCGFIPTAVGLFAANRLGATRCDLVRYGHSGETSGDLDRVVGYAGLIVS